MIKALVAISAIISLTGCGGGGGGSSEEVQSAPNTINGAAFKGLIDGGIVNVYEMTSNNITSIISWVNRISIIRAYCSINFMKCIY